MNLVIDCVPPCKSMHIIGEDLSLVGVDAAMEPYSKG